MIVRRGVSAVGKVPRTKASISRLTMPDLWSASRSRPGIDHYFHSTADLRGSGPAVPDSVIGIVGQCSPNSMSSLAQYPYRPFPPMNLPLQQPPCD